MAYPLPVFHFEVDWGDADGTVRFSEVTGLNVEYQAIEYRDGNEKDYIMQKMPGLKKAGNVTLKRGVMETNNAFWDWANTANLNKVERRDVTIRLLNEASEPTMVWTLRSAWVTKVTYPDLKASGNEVAVEQIELAHEGVSVSNE